MAKEPKNERPSAFEAAVTKTFKNIEGKINRALGMALGDANRDIDMRQSIAQMNAELKELREKVDKFTTEQGNKIKEAVDAAVKARDAQDDAEFNRVTQELDAIGNKLVSFTPSGN